VRDPDRRHQPAVLEGGEIGGKVIGGGNMIAMHLANAVGGNLLLGFLSAVAFATILAVVAGPRAGRRVRDLARHLLARDHEGQGVGDDRAEGVEVRHHRPRHRRGPARHRVREDEHRVHGRARLRRRRLGQFPGADFVDVLERSDDPRRTVGRLLRSRQRGDVRRPVEVGVGRRAAQRGGDLPHTQPALFSMPIAFLLAIIVSKLDTSAAAKKEIEAFEDQYVRAQTGVGAATAAAH